MGNIPLSPQNTMKIASSLLERDFFIVFCKAPPQVGRDVGAQRRNP